MQAAEEVMILANQLKWDKTWLVEHSFGVTAFSDNLDPWVTHEVFKDVQSCIVPVKILTGEHDPFIANDLIHNAFGQWLSKMKITKTTKCGHYPMCGTPVALAASWDSFGKK